MEIFKIKEKEFYNLDGSKEISNKALIRVHDYKIFSPRVMCYYEIYNQKGELINLPINISIDTPEEWGNDDMFLVYEFAKKLGVEILGEYHE